MAKDMYQKRKEKAMNKNESKDGCQKTNINWYPGHMLKTKKQIIEDLKLIDVVIELLDTRIPISSQNPDIRRITNDKKRIIVLNKSDLADDVQNKKWVQKFKEQGITAILADSNTGKGMKECLAEIQRITQVDLEKAALKGRTKKNIRVMILGIPNVGKSSFINRLINKKSAQVGNRPGVTKQKQWLKINNNIELLDTPGVLWPKFEDDKVALNLVYVGSIKDEVVEKTEIAYSLLKYMYKNYKNNLILRYKLTEDEIKGIIQNAEDDITILLMDLIARKRGAIISGGEIDYEKIAGIILTDFRTGKLGKITLEQINGK